jgi:hypothetical protein
MRKEKEKEFFAQHMETFRSHGIADPTFIIKTAYFVKGKAERQFQLFESEITKGTDIYIEFYDNVKDEKDNVTDIVPFNSDRQLFKYKSNPYYGEEYEMKEGMNYKGEPYKLYTIPVTELRAVLKDSTEIPYNVYQKRKDVGEPAEDTVENIKLPRLQKSLFPDFEQEFPNKEDKLSLDEVYNTEIADAPLSEITIRDLAAIMLMKPISARPWLNDIIKQTKSEI